MKPFERTINLKVILLFFLLVKVSTFWSQTIITGIVTDSLNNPYPFAHVYLRSTTISTNSNENGTFVLKIPIEGQFQLFASGVGYWSNGQAIESNGINQNIQIRLFPVNRLGKKAGSNSKNKYHGQFKTLFLGNTPNSLKCKIMNLNDLVLYKDSGTNIIKGFSTSLLRIENPEFGYTIFYQLREFYFNPTSKKLKFAGSYYFKAYNGKTWRKKKWAKNRLNAYWGSRRHFIRCLYADDLNKDNFIVFVTDSITPSAKTEFAKPLNTSDIVFPNNEISKTLYSKHKLVVYCQGKHAYVPKMKSKIYKSIIQFSEPAIIYKNGMFEPPFSINWKGSLANERVADMLPFDFEPDNSFKK